MPVPARGRRWAGWSGKARWHPPSPHTLCPPLLLALPGTLLRVVRTIGGQLSTWGVRLQRSPADYGCELDYGSAAAAGSSAGGGVSPAAAQEFIQGQIPDILAAGDELLHAIEGAQ